MEAQMELNRTVAIVGRPNVGKSALFNRIAHRRIAIVHDQSGVTRDRIVREVAWDDQKFRLIDTGGIRLFDGIKEGNVIEMAVRDQAAVALADAACVILVVDAQAGLQPADEEVARLVRKAGRPCVVAANKCDLPSHEHGAHEFAKLAFPVFPISAAHGRGMEPFMAEVLKHLPEETEAERAAEAKPLRVAIVGRPDVPFTIGSGPTARHYTLVDTAGMRHVHKIDTSVERFSLFRSEEAVRECDVAVLVMDAEIGPTTQDKYISNMIQREGRACVILVNKWDLARAKGATETAAIAHMRELMPYLRHVPVVFMSAQEGYNVRTSIEAIDRVAGNQRRVLPTGVLNRTLLNALERVQTPGREGRKLRFFYATQTGSNPMILRLFVNDARLATKPFQDFLIRTLRESFDLEGAALILQFRSRTRPGDPKTPEEAESAEAKPARRAGGRKPGPAKGRKGGSLTPKSRRPKRK